MQYKNRKPGDLLKKAKGKHKKTTFQMSTNLSSTPQSLLARRIGLKASDPASAVREGEYSTLRRMGRTLKKKHKKTKHSKHHKKGAMCKGC